MYAENMGLFSALLDIIFPPECIGCNTFGSYLCSDCFRSIKCNTTYLCPGCMKEISHFTVHPHCKKQTALDGLYAFSNYEGVLRKYIGAVKYRLLFDMAKIGGDMMYWSGKQLGLWNVYSVQTTAVVPVPIHWKKRWERGFNQSNLYAEQLAKNLGFYLLPNLLIKTKSTGPQALLSRVKRLQNIHDSVVSTVTDPQRLPSCIILVDDVATTGSTLYESARALKKAGVKKVVAIVLAHGE